MPHTPAKGQRSTNGQTPHTRHRAEDAQRQRKDRLPVTVPAQRERIAAAPGPKTEGERPLGIVCEPMN